VDRYASTGKISTPLPGLARDGLTFQPTHPKTAEALAPKAGEVAWWADDYSVAIKIRERKLFS
jgi:hypothetical protein